jgi:MYXO-CTERM domain-containing protein
MKLPSIFAVLTLLALPAGAQDIVGGMPTQNFKAVGIGVQVAPDWVMTARHAVIGVGGTYENGYGMRTVAAVYLPDTADFPANDFALLRLVPNGITGNFYPRVASEPSVPGGFRPLDVTIVSTANHSPRGLGLTVASQAIPFYDDDGPGPLPAVAVNWLVSWDPNVRVENGDSGGGLFLGHVRDSSVLLGLTSALIVEDSGAIGSAFVQPGAYKAWIDGIMNADVADEQLLNWTSASEVPEPAAWMLGAGGLLLLLAGRRRP